jgi:hypothetical protein
MKPGDLIKLNSSATAWFEQKFLGWLRKDDWVIYCKPDDKDFSWMLSKFGMCTLRTIYVNCPDEAG